jgi:5-methylcytosine-specific restriction endonuclease McrA
MKKAKLEKKRKVREFKLEGYIFGALRKIARWHPERRKALKLAEVHGSIPKDTYSCAKCDNLFPKTMVQVDHINPVIDPATGFTTWDNYIARLFVTADKLQVLCKGCHKNKTVEENRKRS